MQETQEMQRQEDPLKSEMATHSIILAWKNCMNRGVWQTVVYGVSKESDMTEQLSARVHTRRHTCTFNDLYLLVSKLSFINEIAMKSSFYELIGTTVNFKEIQFSSPHLRKTFTGKK